MRRAFSYAVALFVPVLLVAGPLAGAPKADHDKDADKTTEKHIKAGQVVGIVKAIYEEKKTLRLDIKVPTINQGEANALAQAQMRYQQALARRDINGARSAMQQMTQHQANLIKYETKPLEIQATDDVVVRAMHPPEQFDDKGKIKKYTKEELKELKGDSKQPGYKAEFGDIQAESVVQVTLIKKKEKEAGPKLPTTGKKKIDKEALEALLAENMPQTAQIMILRGPPPGK